MINLLPPQAKKELYWQRQLKIVVIIELLTIFCLLVLWLAFLVIKVNIVTQQEIVKTTAKSEEPKIKQIDTIKKEINTINETLEKINQLYEEQISVSETLIKIASLLPQDAYLENFVFEEKNKQVQIVGKIRTLTSLNQFKELLKNEPSFKDVELSIGSYVPTKEIEFQAKFILKK